MTDEIHPPTISDVVRSAERTDAILQRTVNSFGPEGQTLLVEPAVLLKTLIRDIATAQAMQTADPELLRRMDRAAKLLMASLEDVARRTVMTKGLTAQARREVLDAARQASRTAGLAREYVVNTLAAKRRKDDPA